MNKQPQRKEPITVKEFKDMWERIMGEPISLYKPNEDLPEGMMTSEIRLFSHTKKK